MTRLLAALFGAALALAAAGAQAQILLGGGGGGGGGSGCTPSGSSGQILTDSGSGTCHSNTTGTGVLTALGINTGTVGSILPNNLASADIFVGSAGGVATAVALSGDSTITNAGVMTNTGLGGITITYGLNTVAINGTTTTTSYAPGDVLSFNTGTNTTPATIYVSYTQVSAATPPTVNTTGSSCSGSSGTLTGTTGTGTKFQVGATFSGGAVTGITGVTVAGLYSVNPTLLSAEPVTGASCSGVTLVLTASMAPKYANVQVQGVYTVPPTGAVSQTAISGSSGAGATWTLGFLPIGLMPAFQNNANVGATGQNENYICPQAFSSGTAFTANGAAGENTLCGWQAGAKITTGSSNSAFGTSACLDVTTTSNNVCIGTDAMKLGLGSGVTAVGSGAFKSNTFVANNVTAVGSGAGGNWNSNTSSATFTALGVNACQGGTNASFTKVVCVGFDAGDSLSSAANGIYLGYSVGTTCGSGAGNVLIGAGDQTVDCALNTTANTINIENIITATGAGTPATSVLTIAGTFNVAGAGGYQAGGTAGVSCAANTVTLLTEVVTNGIVTHC